MFWKPMSGKKHKTFRTHGKLFLFRKCEENYLYLTVPEIYGPWPCVFSAKNERWVSHEHFVIHLYQWRITPARVNSARRVSLADIVTMPSLCPKFSITAFFPVRKKGDSYFEVCDKIWIRSTGKYTLKTRTTCDFIFHF